MGGTGGKKKLDDPEAEAWPVRAGMPRREKKEERWGMAGAVLIVCLMTLPFLIFFFGGRASASTVWQSATKLSAMSGGTLIYLVIILRFACYA